MRDNLDNILNHGECIPEKMMLAYLEGKLTPADQHWIEKHLLGCEICSDAIEGLSRQPVNNVREVLDGLDKKIDARINQGKGRLIKMRFVYRIAAIVVLITLFGGGIFYLQSIRKSENIFVENFTPYRDTSHILLAPSEVISQNTNEHEKPVQSFKSKELTKNSISANEGDVATSKQVITADQTAAGSTAIPGKYTLPEEKALAENKMPAAKSDAALEEKQEMPSSKDADEKTDKNKREGYSITVNDLSKNNQPAQQPEVQSVRKKSEDKSSSTEFAMAPARPEKETGVTSDAEDDEAVLIKEGIVLYEAKNYSNSVSVFKRVLIKSPDQEEALFYSGLSKLSLGEEKEAIQLFEDLLKKPFHKYTEATKWYLSLVYIKKNKTSKARKLLENLSEGQSEYKSNAKKTLDELK